MAESTVSLDILYGSIREQAELIRTQKLSPLDLTKAYLGRLEKYGEKLGAVITITKELALAQAESAEREIKAGKYRGPLHGIPYGAKDLLATKGIPTTWGAEPYRKQVFDYDATAIVKLREAGAILVAKLAMVELAGGFNYNRADASFTGPGRTPWNLDYWSGGSSTGPGAATSAALVAFSVGSETSGSIITPAAFCGISGLRPTYGRVSRHGAMALCWSLDKLGPMCRSADDCGLVLSALAGADKHDPSSVSVPYTWPEKETPKRFKVGILAGCLERIQPEVKKNFLAAVEVIKEFADVTENVVLPRLPFSPVIGTIVKAEGAAAFLDLLTSGKATQLRAPNCQWSGYTGLTVSAVDYLQAMRLREPMKKALAKLYAPYDALICPARNTVSYPIAKDFDQVYSEYSGGVPIIPAGNAVGQPAISVPTGFGPNALPTGLQFTGKIWSEPRLLTLACEYQKRSDWHKRKPPGF